MLLWIQAFGYFLLIAAMITAAALVMTVVVDGIQLGGRQIVKEVKDRRARRAAASGLRDVRVVARV